MELYIAEKPSFGKALAEVLGITSKKNGYIECGDKVVTWAFGHLYAYKDPDSYTSDSVPRNKKGGKVWRVNELPIIPGKWEMIKTPKTSQQIKTISTLLGRCKICINAADPDREGEEIFRNIVEQAGYRGPIKRILCSGYDATSIKRALNERQSSDKTRGFANAARARARADWLIGMNYSRAYTLAANNQKLMAIGRVQTPALKLVVDRDRLIDNFVSVKHFILPIEVKHANGVFNGVLKYDKNQQGLDSEGRMLDRSEASRLVNSLNGTRQNISSLTRDEKSIPPPLLLSQTKIAEIASKKYGYSAKQILDGCQSLYEKHKATTYPRTDCSHLPESHKVDIDGVLETIAQTNPELTKLVSGANPKIESRVFADSKITAHHALCPTMEVSNYSAFSAIEKNLYDLIALHYIAQFYPRYDYSETDVKIKTSGGVVQAKTIVENNMGWKALFGADKADNGNKIALMPKMDVGDNVELKSVDIKQSKTKPPRLFNEGDLCVAMGSIHKHMPASDLSKILKEEDGIGTGATRPNIIDELKQKKYLKKKGKYVTSTDLGRELVDTVPDVVKSPILTALFERQLKEIESGDAEIGPFIDQQVTMVSEEIERIKKIIRTSQTAKNKVYDHNCPECENYGLDRRKNKSNGNLFWACVNPKCNKTYSDEDGRPRLPKLEAES